MPANPFDNYLDLVEAARILRIHPQSLRRLIKQKKVPAVLFAGKMGRAGKTVEMRRGERMEEEGEGKINGGEG